MKKSVAIIGAGPAGLVAAKTLLRSKTCQYQVHVFEKSSEIGGLWATHRDRPYDGLLNPEMPTNLSRFNIGFSDLAWSSIGLEGHVPFWPKAWQVCKYLHAYTDRYIPNDVIQFNTKVQGVEKQQNGKSQWKIRWQQHGKDEAHNHSEGLFDHVIIATGFFGVSATPELANGIAVKVAHSTKLRSFKDVVPNDPNTASTLLVVGGGMSGADVSTLLARQISDAVHGLKSDGQQYSKLKLVQLCPEAAYALPLAAPTGRSMENNPIAPEFLPLDICMYDLGQRPPGDIQVGVGKMPESMIGNVHKAFQNIVGDQSELEVPGLEYSKTTKAAYVTLTEQYPGFIKSGGIKIITGRLDKLSSVEGLHQVRAEITQAGKKTTIDDIVGIVFATGFSPQPSLDFLSPELQESLHYDPKHNRLPIILDEHATLSHEVPGLAVIGYHEGAFWGSMEMAARLVENRWSSPDSSSDPDETTNGHTTPNKPQTPDLHDLRRAMTSKEDTVPQYWLGDYVGLMETIARKVNIQRNDLNFPEPRTGPIATARYTDSTNDQNEANKTLQEYQSILNLSATSALLVSRAAFLAMQGHWKTNRTITSFLPSMPSGTLTGTASFHPRHPTSSIYDFEYLYTESGTFTTNTNNLIMSATRQYVYRYEEATDKITVWFVKPDGRAVDYLYHDLTFDIDTNNDNNSNTSDDENNDDNVTETPQQQRKNGWIAKASHLCINDMYESNYCYKFKGAFVTSLGVTHVVKGPKKDYVSETWYER